MRRLGCAVVALALVAGAARARAEGTAPGGKCVADAECAVGSVCQNKVCTQLVERRRIVPPFYFYQKGAEGYRHVIPALYFHTWDRKGEARVQFPFLFQTYDRLTQQRTSLVPLLLFFQQSSPSQTSTGILPFLFYTTWKRHGSRFMLMPLLYFSRYDDNRWRAVLPFAIDHETKDERTTIAPLFWYHRQPGHAAAVGFPLVWYVRDAELGKHVLVLPIVDYERDASGHKARVVSLFGSWERDDDAHLKQLFLIAPLVFHRDDPQRTVDVVPPLVTAWKVKDDGSRGFIAGPFFHSSDPEGSTSGLFPIYWRFADKKTGAATNLVFPIAGFHHHPGARGGYVGPVYGWSSSNDGGGWGAGVAPIAFFGRNGTQHHAVVLPLFARWSDDADGSSTTAVGPFYGRRTRDGWDAGALPVLFAGRHGDRSYGLVPPIYWHFGQKNGTTDVLGPLYVKRGARGWGFGLAPLFFFGDEAGRAHQVVAPLFFRFVDRAARREQLAVAPLFFHDRQGDATTDVLFPLVYLHRTPSTGLLLTPLAGWSKDAQKETLVVGPWVQQHDRVKQSTTRFLFPLGASHDEPGYHVTVQFPFYWRVHDGDETDTVLFPFYWRVRSPRLAFDGVFPFAVHARSPAASTTVVGPLWTRARTDGGRSLGLFPIFAYGKSVKDGKASSFAGSPIFFWRKNEHTGGSDFVLPPFFDSIRPNGYTAGLVPIAFAWRRGTVSRIVTPLFYRQHDSAADASMNVLGPIYFGHSGPDTRFGLFPILFARSSPERSSATLFPLLYFGKKRDGSMLFTLLFGWSTYTGGKRVWVGPLYVRRDDKVSSTALWPLLYVGRDHETGGSTRLVLPLWFDGRARDGRELQAYTPLVWRYHAVERSIIVGLPLFFDVHSYGESRTTGVLPFVIRNRDWAKDSTSWTVPPLALWVRARRGGPDPGTDVAMFPLFWRFGGKDSTTVFAPLVWDFKRGDDRTTVVLPFGGFWRRVDAERTVFLNMYYRRGINHEEGSWHCYIVPLVDFGRARKQDVEWNVLEGLVGYARQGRKRTLKLLWLFDVDLEPLPASNLSWFGSTPPSARTEF